MSRGRPSNSGSGASSRADSEEPEGGLVGCPGLSKIWDGIAGVRERLRAGNSLCMNFDEKAKRATNEYVGRSVANIKVNEFVLRPVLQIMHDQGGKSVAIDGLIKEVSSLYLNATKDARAQEAYQMGWAIRRLCSLTKSMTYKKQIPKDRVAICCL